MEDAQLTSHLARSRNHLCNLARGCLQRGVNPVWVVRSYAHVLDKQCLRAVIDKANTVDIRNVASLVNGVIPYVPRKWLRAMDPKRAIFTAARFILPIGKIVAGVNSGVSSIIYGPILRDKYDWPDIGSRAIDAVGAAQHAYKYLVAGRRVAHMWEFKNLIGLIGRGGNRSMVMRALKIWNERKHDFITDNCVFYAPDGPRYPECHYDLISSGAVFSMPSKYVITAMDFIMAEYCGRGVYINESTIHYLLYDAPCLHYKVWDFVINLILDALPHAPEHRQRIAATVRAILRRGHLYARLPRSTINRIIYQLPSAVVPKIFGRRDVVAAKVLTVSGTG